MSSEQKIDLTKLSVEDLEKIKFLFPEAVENELKSRQAYETDSDLFFDAYGVKLALDPLINGMKSCPAKKGLLESGVLGLLEKILNTGDKRGNNYKERYECYSHNMQKEIPAPETVQTAYAGETAPVETAPVETAPVETAPVEAPAAPAPQPAPQPFVPVNAQVSAGAAPQAPQPFVPVNAQVNAGAAPQAFSMDQIMKTASMMQQNQQ